MVNSAVVAVAVAGAVGLPHILPLQRVAPVTASAVWLLALALRALVAVGAAVFLFLFLPQTSLFEAVARGGACTTSRRFSPRNSASRATRSPTPPWSSPHWPWPALACGSCLGCSERA